jgi:hypothetical protein
MINESLRESVGEAKPLTGLVMWDAKIQIAVD